MALFLSLLIPHFLSIAISLYVFFAFYTFLSYSLHSHLSLLRLHSLGMAFSLSLLIPFFFSNAKSIYVFFAFYTFLSHSLHSHTNIYLCLSLFFLSVSVSTTRHTKVLSPAFFQNGSKPRRPWLQKKKARTRERFDY